MNVVRFIPAHLAAIRPQAAQAAIVPDPGYAARLEACPDAFTALADDGRVLAICGCEERWAGCAVAFAIIAGDVGRDLRALVVAMRGYFEHAAPWRRIEAYVDAGFSAGDRLAAMLGFERESVARSFRPDGGDCTIWARIRHD